ncbi:hypothetical protein PBY51_011495 [Eleginops maclovinus]|uniref:Uncharacterized protein n=1 Tax=Eleginops maclovinus TaxID=56733 RepID=A0AAN8ALD4_ELEMC|nr:hypothetical protein PBY51_011495 [Eleginops maclovinus]
MRDRQSSSSLSSLLPRPEKGPEGRIDVREVLTDSNPAEEFFYSLSSTSMSSPSSATLAYDSPLNLPPS